MEKSVFFADIGTRLGQKIADVFLANSCKVIKAINNPAEQRGMLLSKGIGLGFNTSNNAPEACTRNVERAEGIKPSARISIQKNTDNETVERTSGFLTEIPWNCNSSFSPKNIIFSLRKYTDISQAFIVYSFPKTDLLIHKQGNGEIQKDIDLFIKSQILLTCEIINEFSINYQSSQIFLILPAISNGNLGNPYRDFFKTYINSILEDSGIKVNINAFEMGKETQESFADFIFSTSSNKGTKTKGKWFKALRYTLF